MTKIFMFPGQGSQEKGMGKGLFEEFPTLTAQADAQLGYSIEELCVEDPHNRLRQTQYTQPALYVVNALLYLKKSTEEKPDWVVGHSLGEYNALFAAQAFDFITGLKLVQKRGELMGQVSGSSMAAVVGIHAQLVAEIIAQNNLSLEIANLNTNTQVVIAGNTPEIKKANAIFTQRGARYIILNVSAAFHSSFMEKAQAEFAKFIADFSLQNLQINVMANYTAQPYEDAQIKTNLIEQIAGTVRWRDCIEYLLQNPDPQFCEIGSKNVLTRMLVKIKQDYTPPVALPKATKKNNIIFMYGGQGCQYYHMGKELYDKRGLFYEWMNRCNEIAKPILGISLVDVIYGDRENRFAEFADTRYTHPALFMFGFSLTQVVLDWQVVPDCVLGHSVGEYVANVVANTLSLEDGLKMVIEQASLIEKHTPAAAIFAIFATPQLLQKSPILQKGWLASVNFANNFALTTTQEDSTEIIDFLKQQKINFQRLPIHHGFHSPLIDNVQKDFCQYLNHLSFKPPQKKIITPTCASDVPAIDRDYLWSAIRKPIDFCQTVTALQNSYEANTYLDLSSSGSIATCVKYNQAALAQQEKPPITMMNAFGKNINSIEKAKKLLFERID